MSIELKKNEDKIKQLTDQLRNKLNKVKLGGGKEKINSHHKKGKMTARERIDYLTDNNSYFLEI